MENFWKLIRFRYISTIRLERNCLVLVCSELSLNKNIPPKNTNNHYLHISNLSHWLLGRNHRKQDQILQITLETIFNYWGWVLEYRNSNMNRDYHMRIQSIQNVDVSWKSLHCTVYIIFCVTSFNVSTYSWFLENLFLQISAKEKSAWPENSKVFINILEKQEDQKSPYLLQRWSPYEVHKVHISVSFQVLSWALIVSKMKGPNWSTNELNITVG